MRHFPRHNARYERGAALPTVLVILFVLTVLGTLALTTAGVEVRLAGNEREYQRALYVAEAGIARMRAMVPLVLFSSSNPASPYVFNIGDPSISGGINGVLNGCTYTVRLFDKNDSDGNDSNGDADGKVFMRADAVTAQGTRASIEILMKAESSEQKVLSDYADGTGDTTVITDTSLQNMGQL
ncbi:MAG: hypothetical protein FIB02_05370 [Desulfuromonas sp.]|nr:hypothetical protein [Desulfuromonas sp.]